MKTFLSQVSTYVLPDEDVLKALWDQYDYNGNGMLSLAEIDKFIVEQFPELNLRTYVSNRGRPGVWFLSIDATSWFSVQAT